MGGIGAECVTLKDIALAGPEQANPQPRHCQNLQKIYLLLQDPLGRKQGTHRRPKDENPERTRQREKRIPAAADGRESQE